MQQPPTISYFPIEKVNSQDVKLWEQIYEILESHDNETVYERILKPTFDTLPDNELLEKLEQTRHTGRPGYPIKVMWHTLVAMYVMNYRTFSQLIRELQNNPLLAKACGINNFYDIPSKYAYSRFLKKLQKRIFIKMVKDVMRELTRLLYKTLPGFGKSVVLDSTDLKAWANGGKKPVSDPDAGWSVKAGSNGKNEFCFGYKLHMLIDTKYEIPLAANITPGNFNDGRAASRVLSEARFTYGKFHPEYIIGDAGYSSNKLRRLIRRQYRAEPIIKVNPAHKKALFPETQEWRDIWDLRSAIERVNGRLKGYRRLNNITVRGKWKVTIHCYLSMMVVQAQYLSAYSKQSGIDHQAGIYAR